MSSQPPIYIVLGSGGHTAEMCKINQALLKSSRRHMPQRFLLAKTDATSRDKIISAMSSVGVTLDDKAFIEVPRSREVGQSWLSTIFTTLWALLCSFWLVWRDRPQLVLCNGPGTCVPFCVAAYLWRMLGRLEPTTKIVFVESFCRVQTLSLSGKLLLPFVDLLVVQWPALAERLKHKKNVEYFGQIM